MNKITREEIKSILQDCVDRAIVRVNKDATYRPFHEALLTKKLVELLFLKGHSLHPLVKGQLKKYHAYWQLQMGRKVKDKKRHW